jgi:hypothetical protein
MSTDAAPEALPPEDTESTVIPLGPRLSVVEDKPTIPDAEAIVPLAPLPERVKTWVQDTALPWARDLVVPPDIVTEDQPSLRKLHEYGRSGQQVPDKGVLRTVSRVWSLFAIYHAARGALRGWLMARPARAAVFLALLVTTALIPDGRRVLTLALWPAHTAIARLTNN